MGIIDSVISPGGRGLSGRWDARCSHTEGRSDGPTLTCEQRALNQGRLGPGVSSLPPALSHQ